MSEERSPADRRKTTSEPLPPKGGGSFAAMLNAAIDRAGWAAPEERAQEQEGVGR